VWGISTAGLVAGSGGFASPVAVALLLAPALALGLARPWREWVGAAAAASYVLAAVLASVEPPANLGVFPMALAFAAFSLVVWLMTRAANTSDVASRWRIAEAAHELRTPLTHIMGFAEMIERRMFGGEIADRYVEYASLIRHSGAQLHAMVTDILDLSSIDAGRRPLTKSTFDVRDVAAEVVRLSAEAAGNADIKLAMVTPETPVHIHADRDAVRRMLTNILGNAMKFTPEGGEVIVQARAYQGALVLEAADSGPGFSDTQSLGRPYERGATREPGTGLGLALVRALARQHGGEVQFLAAPSGGALVRIVLPVLSAGS
jgi:two-component system cell cycle sensor histidine kinase PleC